MIGALAGLLVPAVAVWLSVRAWIPHASRSTLATAALSVGGGIGLSALLTTWMIFGHLYPGGPFVAVDAIVWAAIALAAWRHAPRTATQSSETIAPALTALDRLLRVVFVVVAVMAVATAVMEYRAAPHGQWDAWAIWNQKARFLFRGREHWTNALLIDFSNPGHPLVVPASVARLWAYGGSEVTIAPALIAFCLAAAGVAVVMGSLDLRRARAWIAGAVIVAPATYLHQAMSQQADVPVGFFIVATLALLLKDDVSRWKDGAEARATLVAAGVTSGLATWTKNEGLVFLAIAALLVAWLVWRYGRLRDVLWWIAGAAPTVLTVLWFKLRVAPVPPPYLDKNAGAAQIVARLLDAARWEDVLSRVWWRGAEWGGPMTRGIVPLAIAAAAALAMTRAGRRARPFLAAVLCMLASYIVVYFLSPVDIGFLVSTSFDRVLAQIWPALVLVLFAAALDK